MIDSIPSTRLSAANPVREAPAVPAAERLRELIEQEAWPATSSVPRRGRRGSRLAAGVAVCIAVAVAGALLSGGGRSGLNVAAAAYAATAPRAGVTEAVWFSRVLRGSGRGNTLRMSEWVEASAQRREQRDVISGPSEEVQRSDWVFAPRRQEYWGVDGALRGVHPRPRIRLLLGREDETLKVHAAFGGLVLYGSEGMRLYRDLYEQGELRLTGHAVYRGRRVWRLESRPERTTDIVLVDPHSFLPVVTRLRDNALPGHPTISETRLVSYRSLTPAEVPPGTFHLHAQHPHASVFVAHPPPSPK